MTAKKTARQAIPECLAYEKCKTIGADCDVCLQLSANGWREHVRKVLARG